jgi:CBS domain containing-hemolysin-like protein
MIKLELASVRGPLAPPQIGAWRVALEDPARSVMTDFHEHGIVSVREGQQVDAALEHMRHAGVRSAFVLDEPRERVLGLITAYDIMGEKPLRFEQEMGVAREAVSVGDIMEPTGDWAVLRLADVDRVPVAAVLEAFKRSGRSHLPVIAEEAGGTRLRGVFSSSKLLRLSAASRGARESR